MANKITVNKLDKFIKTAADRDRLPTDVKGLVFMKLKNGGAWRLRYTDPVTGKRRTATIGDHNIKPQDAAAKAAEFSAKVSDGIDPLAEIESKRQEQAAKHHLNTGAFFTDIYTPALIKHSGDKSAHTTCVIINKEFSHLFDRDMDKLCAADVRAWENKRKADGLSRDSLQRKYAPLKAMLNYAAGKKRNHSNDHPLMEVNPLTDVSLQQLSHDEREAKNERQEELQKTRDLLPSKTMAALINSLELFDQQARDKRRSSRTHGKPHLTDLDNVTYAHWFVPFMTIARLTGMRPSDVLSLKFQNIQTSIKTRSEVLTFKPNKTKHHDNAAQVTIPLTGELAIVIDAWREQQGSPTSGFMFESKVSGRAMDSTAYQRHWNTVKELAGVDKSLHLYSFRHNFISKLVANGVPLLRIAKLVGHKDASMIAEHYFHEDVDDLGAILAAIGNDWTAPKLEASA
jgi:integrase